MNSLSTDNDITREQAEIEIRAMCEKLSIADLGKLTQTPTVLHEIRVTDEKPIRQPPRKIPVHKQQELRDMLNEMFTAAHRLGDHHFN